MEWISITNKNKLPKPEEIVLVTYIENGSDVRHVGTGFLRNGIWHWEDDSKETIVEVTAWAHCVPYGTDQSAVITKEDEINVVTVRWFDSYMEEFRATEVRVGGSFLWMRLESGITRQIPLTQVRWISPSIESHQRII